MTTEHEYQTGIVGAGWLGLPLARALQAQGQSVAVTVSSLEKATRLRDGGIAAWPLLLAPEAVAVPQLETGTVDLALYDRLLGEFAHEYS